MASEQLMFKSHRAWI